MMGWLESIFQDLRYGLRAMRRTPLVTAVAVLSLALGIGANTAIFSVLDGFLLRLLPVKNPREIVLLSWSPKNSVNRAEPDHSFSFPMFERFRHSPVGVAGFSFIDNFSLVARGHAEFARGEAVSGNYHSVLGIAPVIGRALTDDDDRDSAAPVCVISYHAWETRFGRDPAVIGQTILLANVPVTLVGVEPKEFVGLTPGYAADFRIPFRVIPKIAPNHVNKSIFLDPGDDWVKIAARVPRENEAQARAEINVLFQQSLPPDQRGGVVRFGHGGEGWDLIGRQFRSPLLVLMAAVGLILLIACANVANLLLARAQAREKETSMRLALGAGTSRVVRQFLTESLLLAAAGGTLGIILAYRAGDLLARGFTDLTFDVHPDISVLMFTGAVTLFTGILFGLAPAIRAARVDIQPGLQRDTRASRFGLSHMLIVAQLALSLVAVVGAGLYVRTLHNLRITDLGMNTRDVMIFKLVPAASGYTNARAAEFAQRVLDRLERMPGVASVGLARNLPLQGAPWDITIDVPGTPTPSDPNLLKVSVNLVTAGFFETMGIPVLLGRGIEERDRVGAPRTAVINETLARAYFPHESPIGRHFLAEAQDYEIVGVVGDSRYDRVRGAVFPSYFASYAQSPNFRGFGIILRTFRSPNAVSRDVRRAIAEIDPNVPLSDLATVEQTIDRLLRQDRLFAGLSSIFGALALLLAAIGLYGVRAYAVARRTPEIGIRMALGADRGTITQMILRETGWLALVGVAIGLGVAYAVTRYIQSMLYGLAPRDFTTFASAALVLIIVAAIAGYLPARRASKVDPMIALRHE
jgi:predicted permease